MNCLSEFFKPFFNYGLHFQKVLFVFAKNNKLFHVLLKVLFQNGSNAAALFPVNAERIKFEQQLWKSGVRVYGGETRARCKTILLLKCESTTKVTKTDSFIPDVSFRMRVLDARLTYDDFVVEHTAGVGGEVAQALGDALHSTVKQIKPSLEKNMLEKANKAIVKAGDTKEVKLGIGKLLEGK